MCFLLVSAGDRSFCGPGANRVIAAWNLNDMVMNEPAGWGKQNHVLWNRMVFGSQGGSFHYMWSLFCSCSEIQGEPHLRHFMAWHCRMITGCRFACGTSTLIQFSGLHLPVCMLQLVLRFKLVITNRNQISAPLPIGIDGVGFLRNHLWIILDGFVFPEQQLICISK